MTAPAYTTDLATVHLAETGGGTWLPSTATGWTATGSVVNETDYFIQGVSCSSRNMKAGVGACMTPVVGNFTVPTDGAILVWLKCDAPNCLAVESSGGIRLMLGNTQAVFWAWNLLGSNTYPFGGWVCLAANDTVAKDYTLGSPASPFQIAGAAVNMPTSYPAKGNPFGVDAIRVGRCEARFAYGAQADGYCTFAGYAAVNDLNTNPNYNRWGLIQSIAGGYQWQGLMVLGYVNACDFRDSNVAVVIANTKKVTANFNTIEVRQAGSNINWTNVAITALGTVSPGRWVTTDNATIALTNCTFTDMGAFGFQSNTTCSGTTFRRCGAITPVGGKLLGCRVEGSTVGTNTSAVVWNNTNPSGYLDNTAFVKGATANHAIEFPTDCPDAISLPGCTFSGYNVADNSNDSALHIKRANGTVTITCAALPSVRSDGATIVKVGTSVTVTVYAKDIGGNNVDDARILLKAADGNGPYPYNVTVTITNSGATATVSHTAHNMATGDKVLIDGASLWQNNGVFSITKINDNSYSYTLPEAPGSNPSGTIKATFVALSGVTASGFLSTSREYPNPQNVTGWIRKSSGQPYYKPAPLTGTIPSSGSFSATGVMISDE